MKIPGALLSKPKLDKITTAANNNTLVYSCSVCFVFDQWYSKHFQICVVDVF